MKKSLLELYGLAVCFFTVACFVIVLGIAAWNLISIVAPGFTLGAHEWEKHQTDQNFRDSLLADHRYGPDKDTYRPPEGEALTTERERSYAMSIRSHAREALQSLIQNCIILGIDIVLFLIHWGIAARARQTSS